MNWLKSLWSRPTVPGGFQTDFRIENNFSPRAQQVLALARKEAERYRHNFVGTEHVLLGLIKLEQGVAVSVVQKLGVNLERVRQEVERWVPIGPDEPLAQNIPYTPRVKKVIQLAIKEAKALRHTYVGTEHLLLGLLREGDGVAARVLQTQGVKAEQIRLGILREIDPNARGPADETDLLPLPRETDTPLLDVIDTSKRYDVYCQEGNRQRVYRQALFKGRRRLLGAEGSEGEFLELEQSNGQTVFLSVDAVRRFCEPGATDTGEVT